MLKKATNNNLKDLTDFCENSILGTKILCLCLCYGFNRDFFDVWYQVQGKVLTAVVTRFFDDVTVVCRNIGDLEDLKLFLTMLSFKTLSCNEDICNKLGFKKYSLKNGYEFSGNAEADSLVEFITEPYYKKAYELISEEISGSFKNDKDSYLSFLSDFTFREKRDRARGFCIKDGNDILTTTITSSESDKAAVLSGVACRKNIQSKGLGKKTVLTATSFFIKKGKKVYVIALNESAEGFYEHIGFIKKEKISFVERENYV